MTTTKIDERKNIITSFNSYLEPKKDIIKYLKILITLHAIITIFIIGFIIISSLSEVLEYDFFRWNKIGLLVILSISLISSFPYYYYLLKLFKHFKIINNVSEFEGVAKLNTELKKIINKSIWGEFALAAIIVVMGLWQVASENTNPYWSYMKLPIVIFYGIVIFRFIVTNRKLSRNIKETEKLISV